MRLFATLLLATALLTGCPSLNNTGTFVPPASYDTVGGGVDGVTTDTSVGADTSAGAQDTAGGVAQDAGVKKDAGTLTAALSCKGKCGGKYNPALKCQCNTDCAKFGNCCADYGPLCQPDALTCKGRCDTTSDKSALCHCSWNCGRYGNCCADYLGLCQAGTDLEMPLADASEIAFCDKPANLANVEYAKDGDTIELINGDIVRFLVVNSPELSSKDCYATEAHQWTKAMVKKVKTVCLIMDPSEGDKDVYGRLLRYVRPPRATRLRRAGHVRVRAPCNAAVPRAPRGTQPRRAPRARPHM